MGIPPSCSALFGSTSPPPGRGHGAWMPSGGSKPLDRSIVEGPLARAVWMLAWPTMLQNLIAGLQGVVDHALVGHFVGYAGNAAIGVGIQIFIVVIVFVISVLDRKSTCLNSSHSQISYAVFCLKKKNTTTQTHLVI